MKDIHIREHRLKSGKKSYEYRFEAAAVDGKRKWITKSGFATKAEARRAGLLAQQQYENGILFNYTFCEGKQSIHNYLTSPFIIS